MRYPPPIEERLRSKSRVLENGCIEYLGKTLQRSGHVHIGYQRKPVLVHRLVWSLANGPIPDGLVVRHSCDNPPCINIDHLLLGTVADNNRDRDERGRHVALRGEDNGHHRWTAEQVLEIRRLCAAGVDQREIARRYNTKQGVISNIHRRKVWAHLLDEHGAPPPFVPPVGEESHSSKLTESDIHEIRRLLRLGNMSMSAIGRLFGVTGGNIAAIRRKQTWSHVPEITDEVSS